jgi:hypothetical protein
VCEIATCAQGDLSTDYRVFFTGGYGQFTHSVKSLLFLKIIFKKYVCRICADFIKM